MDVIRDNLQGNRRENRRQEVLTEKKKNKNEDIKKLLRQDFTTDYFLRNTPNHKVICCQVATLRQSHNYLRNLKSNVRR